MYSSVEFLSLKKDGYFEPNKIKSYWNEHKLGNANRQNQLWSILMFQAWRLDQ